MDQPDHPHARPAFRGILRRGAMAYAALSCVVLLLLGIPAQPAHADDPGAAISTRASQLGLGSPTGGLVCGLRDGGCYQWYGTVGILWSPASGAQPSSPGAIRQAWVAQGYENGRLGYPTSAENCGLAGGGCRQTYQGGTLYWTVSTGANAATPGAILQAWTSQGSENGRLGYPVGGEVCGLRDGGCYQMFAGGGILWSPASGAYASTPGAIRQAWVAQGYENGRLGYPTSGESCGLRDAGCVQSFQGGALYWTAATGAQPMTPGAIRQAWAAMGAEGGVLGYPLGPEVCGMRDGGCGQVFQGGSVYWSPSTGAQPSLPGAIRWAWGTRGYEAGPLGYPVGPEVCQSGSCRQNFQRGFATWSAQDGARLAITALDTIVVNKRRPLSPIDYVPTPLETVGSTAMQSEAAAWARSLLADARAAGIGMTTVSGYRDYWSQASLYNSYVAQYGQAQADLISARPGYSEHQSGLALDIGDTSGACALQACFENTGSGSWARDNAWRYGFIVRYPQGYTWATGYDYEPWHLRYVGRAAASAMRFNGIPTLEEFYALPAAPGY
ncbi:D-alanyl-D-alanine carboxypeptidase family protein [Sinomonas atrocyanea]|uniref:D-alanyl-D-alanine carboxypeptidase family protein n=1 Tax=Sinomonas atrocyanea TaxID=37927 RepID=UPI003D9640CA